MSGLGNNNTGVIFVNAKAGKFYLSSDKEKVKGYENLSGRLMGIEFKEETFNGAPIKKAYFSISASSGIYKFNVPVMGGAYGNLISFIRNADVSRDLTIVAKAEEGQEGKINTAYLVRQDEKALKGYFSKGSGRELPRWVKVEVNGKPLIVNGREVWDKEAYLVALEGAVNEINAIANANDPIPVTTSAPEAPAPAQEAQGTVATTQTATGAPQTNTSPATTTTSGGVTKATVAPQGQPEDDDSDGLPF